MSGVKNRLTRDLANFELMCSPQFIKYMIDLKIGKNYHQMGGIHFIPKPQRREAFLQGPSPVIIRSKDAPSEVLAIPRTLHVQSKS
jgi:hypothetical protein